MTDRETYFKTLVATREHIDEVRLRLIHLAKLILDRALAHDASKLVEPEASAFAEVNHKLSGTTFGSPEYVALLKELEPTLDHHYARNSHHPQHYKNGIADMNLLDLLEMLADWKSATLRHNDGNINKSLDFNASRFGIDAQLLSVLRNTLKDIL